MTAELGASDIPEWAREERQQDILWIKKHMHLFWMVASAAFTGSGRGAIVVDTTALPIEGMGHPYGYYLRTTIEEIGDADIKRLVREYHSDREFVIVLLFALFCQQLRVVFYSTRELQGYQ
jgi:hypothetical protein